MISLKDAMTLLPHLDEATITRLRTSWPIAHQTPSSPTFTITNALDYTVTPNTRKLITHDPGDITPEAAQFLLLIYTHFSARSYNFFRHESEAFHEEHKNKDAIAHLDGRQWVPLINALKGIGSQSIHWKALVIGRTLRELIDWTKLKQILDLCYPDAFTPDAENYPLHSLQASTLIAGYGPFEGMSEAEHTTLLTPLFDLSLPHFGIARQILLARIPCQQLIDIGFKKKKFKHEKNIYPAFWVDFVLGDQNLKRVKKNLKKRTLQPTTHHHEKAIALLGEEIIPILLQDTLKNHDLPHIFHTIPSPIVIANLYPNFTKKLKKAKQTEDVITEGLLFALDKEDVDTSEWATAQLLERTTKATHAELLNRAQTHSDHAQQVVKKHIIEVQNNLLSQDELPKFARLWLERAEDFSPSYQWNPNHRVATPDGSPPIYLPKTYNTLTTHEGTILPEECTRGLCLSISTSDKEVDHLTQHVTLQSLQELAAILEDELNQGMTPGNDAKYHPWYLLFIAKFASQDTIETAVDHAINFSKKGRYHSESHLDSYLFMFTYCPRPEAKHALKYIAQWVKSKRLIKMALNYLSKAQKESNLQPHEFEDICVPTFGLSMQGERTFDFGSRTFLLKLNEDTLTLTDENDNELDTLPRIKKSDDKILATKATQAFKKIQENLKQTLLYQRSRLEKEMVVNRIWTLEHLQTHILNHPIMNPIACSLIWAVIRSGKPPELVRPTPDGTFLGVDMDEISLRKNNRLCIARPHMIQDTRQAWIEHLTSFEVIQPFEQLDRKIITADEDGLRYFQEFIDGTRKLDAQKLCTMDTSGAWSLSWRPPGVGYPKRSYELYIELEPGKFLQLHLENYIVVDSSSHAVKLACLIFGPINTTKVQKYRQILSLDRFSDETKSMILEALHRCEYEQ